MHPHVDTLHACGTGVRAHEPVVNAAHVIEVHAGEQADGLALGEVHHTYRTSAGREREKYR